MCTVMLRFDPTAPRPVLLAAVRDEFVDRPWEPPARHWGGPYRDLVGGRDRIAGGTWLAVDPGAPAVAAILNGVRLPPTSSGTRPSRGALPLQALTGQFDPGADFAGYDGFHLLRATAATVDVWSWDGVTLIAQSLAPGDHIVVNLGVDDRDDPLVPHFAPLLRATPTPPVLAGSTADAWGAWLTLLGGDGLDPADDRALLVRHVFGDKTYGSTSATLVALGRAGGAGRYDFSADPWDPTAWRRID